MKRPSNARRLLVMLLLLLTGGALVNVAVAWGIAYIVTPTTSENSLAFLDRRAENDRWVRCSSATRTRAIGVERVDMGTAFIYVTAESTRTPDALPHWIPSATRAKWGTPDWLIESGALSFWAQGWPALAVRCEWSGPFRSHNAAGLGTKFAGFRPIWPGFAINTILYAGILWLLLAAPFALRKRIRIKRGLCPACAYPVGTWGGEVCTECGRAVKAHLPHGSES